MNNHCCARIFLLLFICSCFSSPTNAESKKAIQDELATIYNLIAADPAQALLSANKVMEKYAKKFTSQQQVELFSATVMAHMYSSDFSAAFDEAEKIKSIAEQEKNDYFLFKYNDAKGKIYLHMDLGQESLKYQLKAYEYFKKNTFNIDIDVEMQKTTTEGNIGYTLVQLGFYQEAIIYLEKTLDIFHKRGSLIQVASSYNNLGEAYFGLKKYSEAFDQHQKALNIRLAHNLELHSTFSYHNLGILYRVKKDYAQAESSLLKAINLRQKHHFTLGVLASQVALAEVYRDNNQKSRLKELLNNVIHSAESEDKFVTLAKAYALQRDVFQQEKSYKAALDAAIKHQATIEHVQLKKTDAHLARYLTQSSTVTKDLNILELRKNNEIQMLQVQNEKQRLSMVLTAGMSFIVILMLFLWLLQIKRNKIQNINGRLSSTIRN